MPYIHSDAKITPSLFKLGKTTSTCQPSAEGFDETIVVTNFDA